CCLVKNMGAEDEDIVDLFVSVPYLGETLVRAFHDVKGGAYIAGGVIEVLTGIPGLHLSSECKRKIKAKKEEYLSQGYVEVQSNPDYHNRTNEGIDYFDFDALFERKPARHRNSGLSFLDKNHYLKQILYRQWDASFSEINEANGEALANNMPVELLGKDQLLKTYDEFLTCVFKVLASEIENCTISASVLEAVLERTYRGMHKLYVAQAITVKTLRKDSVVPKEVMKKDLKIHNNIWYDALNYYGDVVFSNSQIMQLSQRIGYDILERIE
ncbi:MAG: hypothetical protein IKK18_03195, partial [Clostridia bacterium]|nr:hypothetical protein [Clostridia bacterium]